MALVALFMLLSPFLASQLFDGKNLEDYLSGQNIVLVVYGVEWCRFSNYMKQVAEETNEKLANMEEFKNLVQIVNLDCVHNDEICTKNGIMKYPTSIIYSHGIYITEYVEERNSEAIIRKLKSLVEDQGILIRNEEELVNQKKKGKNLIVGFFSSTPHKEISVFVGLFTQFHFVLNMESEMHNGESIRYYKAKDDTWTYFEGLFTDYKQLGDWVKMVTEESIVHLDFRNAERLTSLGKPLFILFLNEKRQEMLDLFQYRYDNLLYQIKDRVIYAYADCNQFLFPLAHFNKGPDNCPLFMIDSLAHMYLFHGDIEDSLRTNMTLLVDFINDFFSEKLHKRIHKVENPEDPPSENVFNVGEVVTVKESQFKLLAPSPDRYSFRDEL